MNTKDVILELRTKKGLSQDELAEKVFVTRQAVSRWENGETTPNTETLKLLSKLFDVSINTLLGSPRNLVCQCCGMPLEDSTTSKDVDGSFNEEYCKWCFNDGEYSYSNMDDLIEVCVKKSVAFSSIAPESTELHPIKKEQDNKLTPNNLNDLFIILFLHQKLSMFHLDQKNLKYHY